MTNHSYFNLDGDAGSNADHLLSYRSPMLILSVDSTFMTSGEDCNSGRYSDGLPHTDSGWKTH